MKEFSLTDKQAEAILDISLRKITSLEKNKFIDEEKSLSGQISKLQELLSSSINVAEIFIVLEYLYMLLISMASHPRTKELPENTAELKLQHSHQQKGSVPVSLKLDSTLVLGQTSTLDHTPNQEKIMPIISERLEFVESGKSSLCRGSTSTDISDESTCTRRMTSEAIQVAEETGVRGHRKRLPVGVLANYDIRFYVAEMLLPFEYLHMPTEARSMSFVGTHEYLVHQGGGDIAAHTTLKPRKEGHDTQDELERRNLRDELEDRERRHF